MLTGVVLAAALPLLLAVLAMGPGGLPHEAGFQAGGASEISVAALDRLERWFQGDLTVRLQNVESTGFFDGPLSSGDALLSSALVPLATALEVTPVVAFPLGADAVRRF